MKKILKTLLAAALCLGIVGCSSEEKVETIRIQFVPTNADTADAATADFEAYMENLLGIDVEVSVATSYNTIVEAMQSGKVDVGIMPPATYVQARGLDAAEVILSSTLVDYDQTTEQPIEGTKVGNFKAEVLVRADSDIDTYEELAKAKVAYLGASSASGYIYPVAEMKEKGITVDTSNWTEITAVTNAISAVINGQVEACFVFEGARYVFRDAGLGDLFTELKVALLSEGDIPNDAVAVHPDLSDETKAAIKDAFLKMASDEEGIAIMGNWGHTGYVEASDDAYDTIENYIEKAAE